MNALETIKSWPGRFREFVTEVRNELKKTSWPSRSEVYGTTLVVILTVFFFGFYLFLVDFALQQAVQRIISFFRVHTRRDEWQRAGTSSIRILDSSVKWPRV